MTTIPIGYQLYSSRNFSHIGQTLQMLAEIGYSTVEGYPDVLADAEGLATDLRRFGLTMPSIHAGIERLEDDFEDLRQNALTLGIKAIFCPYLDADMRPTDAQGWSDFGARLQAIADKLAPDGIVFGWHNHDFEFQPLNDGSIPMQHILAAAPAIVWEADIAWIVRGGADPFDWIAKHGQRIAAVHVKDIAPEGSNLDEDGWADIGHGTMDWPGLIQALENAPVTHWIAEHDNPSDDRRFAEHSFQSFRTWAEARS